MIKKARSELLLESEYFGSVESPKCESLWKLLIIYLFGKRKNFHYVEVPHHKVSHKGITLYEYEGVIYRQVVYDNQSLKREIRNRFSKFRVSLS